MKINTLASPTFGWLKMNGAELIHVPAVQKMSPAIKLPEGVKVETRNRGCTLQDVRMGGGSEFTELLQKAEIPELLCTVPEGANISDQDALRLRFSLPDTGEPFDPDVPSGQCVRCPDTKKAQDAPAAAGKFSRISLVLEKGSEMTAVMDFHSDETACGAAGVQTRVSLAEGAKLTLVQVVRPGEGYTFINDVGAWCGKGAELQVIHLVLSGGTVYQGLSAALAADRSKFSVDIAYLGRGSSRYDMNYEAIHTGKKTESRITARGVLRDHASKLFRDSIDFKNGCSDSEGNETEEVLLMDETVKNRSLPIILCNEEKVVGNHGASIGRLDEGLLFYMESRGMNRDEIYEMMAKARLDAVLRMIPDGELRCELLECGEGEVEEAFD